MKFLGAKITFITEGEHLKAVNALLNYLNIITRHFPLHSRHLKKTATRWCMASGLNV